MLDGASVDLGRLFSQSIGRGSIGMGIGSGSREGWMVPVQDGNAELRFSIHVAVSMRRAFGGCLGHQEAMKGRGTLRKAIGEPRAGVDPWISEWGNPPSDGYHDLNT